MESYIEDKKNLYTSILEFFDESDEHSDDEAINKSFEKIIEVLQSHHIETDREEMHQFLEIIKSIGDHHHRDPRFNAKMNQLLFHYKDQIKQTMSNLEIFHFFKNNKKIVHFLLQKDIITISDEIYNEMMSSLENNGQRYCHFFIPELENFVGEEKMNYFKDELLKENPTIFTNYENNREEGENSSQICSLIRQDSIEEFITYVNRHNISPSSEISPSVFETNPFLIDNKNTSLIEYSAFFGSIQIFQYLLTNDVELTPSLWLYAIHSKNAEMINQLESNNVSPPKNYEHCLFESIKCHHNYISNYIENNLIDQKEKDSHQQEKKEEKIISNYIKYHNYRGFKINDIINYGFFYLNLYHYDILFNHLLKEKKESIKQKLIQYPNIQAVIESNDVEVIYHYLLGKQEISGELFYGAKIKRIAIPSSITKIGDAAFCGCIPLKEITIPPSVTSIGNHTFGGCLSLKQFIIPPSITSIGEEAFFGCKSLAQITIPSSVASIGKAAFKGCSSLTQITIPSSVTEIGDISFNRCSSLTQIIIPSSVTSIGNFSFSGCSSLTQITIPSSVTSVGKAAFSYCSSLTQITFEIPSSVTSIGKAAFSECSSLTQITIPSSVTSIGGNVFDKCVSLTQILVPSSLNIEPLKIYQNITINTFS